MRRYSIEMTSMQWGLIAIDLSRHASSDSSSALVNLIRRIMDHVEDPVIALPYNVKDVSDGVCNV